MNIASVGIDLGKTTIIECPENILHLEAEYICADCLFANFKPLARPLIWLLCFRSSFSGLVTD